MNTDIKEQIKLIEDYISGTEKAGKLMVNDYSIKNVEFHLNILKGVKTSLNKLKNIKCTCPEENQTGTSTVKCCNVCGLPVEEFWTKNIEI